MTSLVDCALPEIVPAGASAAGWVVGGGPNNDSGSDAVAVEGVTVGAVGVVAGGVSVFSVEDVAVVAVSAAGGVAAGSSGAANFAVVKSKPLGTVLYRRGVAGGETTKVTSPFGSGSSSFPWRAFMLDRFIFGLVSPPNKVDPNILAL